MQSCRRRRYRNGEEVNSFGWLDVGRSNDQTFRWCQQKERRARELCRALLILLLRIGATLIGLGLCDAAGMVSGMAVGLDLIRALAIDTAVVSSFRGGFPAGAWRGADAEQGEYDECGGQAAGHVHPRVSHRNALSRADLPNETNCFTAAGYRHRAGRCVNLRATSESFRN